MTSRNQQRESHAPDLSAQTTGNRLPTMELEEARKTFLLPESMMAVSGVQTKSLRLPVSVELAFEIADNLKDLIKVRRRLEEHLDAHRLIIAAPVRNLILGWY